MLLSSQRVQAKLLLDSVVWALLLLYCCLQNGAQVLANGMAQANADQPLGFFTKVLVFRGIWLNAEGCNSPQKARG